MPNRISLAVCSCLFMSSMSYIGEKKDVDEKGKRKEKKSEKCYRLLAPFNEKFNVVLASARPSAGFEIFELNFARFPACDCAQSWFVDGVVLALFKPNVPCPAVFEPYSVPVVQQMRTRWKDFRNVQLSDAQLWAAQLSAVPLSALQPFQLLSDWAGWGAAQLAS